MNRNKKFQIHLDKCLLRVYSFCTNCINRCGTVSTKSAWEVVPLIQLDFRSSQPIYEQIMSQYKFLILQGYLKNGDAIPSVRKLAMQLQITPGTVAKAYREMESQGVIETLRGKGTFIAGVPEQARNEGVIENVKGEIKKQCMELIYQGMDKEEILRIVEEILKELQGGKK